MSVQSEIDRIRAAKMDIAAAISNKGVVVPTNTKIDSLAPFINRIEAGGGSSDPYECVEVTLFVEGENVPEDTSIFFPCPYVNPDEGAVSTEMSFLTLQEVLAMGDEGVTVEVLKGGLIGASFNYEDVYIGWESSDWSVVNGYGLAPLNIDITRVASFVQVLGSTELTLLCY